MKAARPELTYVPDDVLELAARFCTAKQMEVLRLRNEGYGHRKIARMLGITPSSAKGRLDGADLKLQRVLAAGACGGVSVKEEAGG